MTQLPQEILDKYQVRKSKKQKARFLQFMQEHLPEAIVEKSWLGKNLVVGDVKSAKILLTAHYDTCSQLPFPNFITPYDGFIYIMYQILIIIPFLLLFSLSTWLCLNSGNEFLEFFAYEISLWVFVLSMGFVFTGPIANKHTVNDNTSGVITLCEIYAALTPEQRKQVCFVFFDNEENGLLGSSAFASKHKKEDLKEKLVLNFDCVSEGDHILMAAKKKVVDKYGDLLNASFQTTDTKTVDITHKAFYPSDQSNFKQGVGIAALRRHKTFGLMLDKVHTKRDTVLQEENIDFLRNCTINLIQTLCN